jgi:hypothetical protein
MRARPCPKVGPGTREPVSGGWWPDGPFSESTSGKSGSGNEVNPDALTLRVMISAISFV